MAKIRGICLTKIRGKEISPNCVPLGEKANTIKISRENKQIKHHYFIDTNNEMNKVIQPLQTYTRCSINLSGNRNGYHRDIFVDSQSTFSCVNFSGCLVKSACCLKSLQFVKGPPCLFILLPGVST